jgi:heptosyltransferase I
MGDVVCSLPVASALKRGHPGCEVFWAVERRFAGIVECCPDVDSVLTVGSSLAQWRRTVAPIEPFDAALDLQSLFKSAWPCATAKARRRVGHHWQREAAWLFSSRVEPDPSSLHVVDQYVDVARAVGGVADRAEFALAPLAEDLAAVRHRLLECGWTEGPLVLMNAGAGWATKRWPAARFAGLADRLAGSGVEVAFLGAPGDREGFEAVRTLARARLIDMVGKTSVRELVALVSLAAVHVGGDTGSSHIAAALGVSAVGIYLVTSPVRSCPYGQIDLCLDAREGDVSVEAVHQKVEIAMGGR